MCVVCYCYRWTPPRPAQASNKQSGLCKQRHAAIYGDGEKYACELFQSPCTVHGIHCSIHSRVGLRHALRCEHKSLISRATAGALPKPPTQNYTG